MDSALEPKYLDLEGKATLADMWGKLVAEPHLHRKGSDHPGPGKQRP